MSPDAVAIRVRDVSKHYLMFARPEDRLKQSIVPRLQRLAGHAPTQYYRDFAALSDVSFEVKRGETVGIVGRNGCGKSTLLQIVCGTLQPTSGTVEVNGRIAALLELGAGFNPEFTGRENVYLNGAILGMSTAEIDQRFDAIARFADIGQFIEHPVKTYSSGMYVRLAFATAVNVDPDILVVDEALAVGDEAFQRKCFARIEDIKDKGGTILFVSHGAQTIVQLCDRALLIDRGEKILEGPPKMVVSQYQRLVNAPEKAAEGLRTAIRAQQHLPVEAPPEPAHADPMARTNGNAAAVVQPAVDDDLFDGDMRIDPTVVEEADAIRIGDVQLTTERGFPVNRVSMGRRYVVRYRVAFGGAVEKVYVSMAIRISTGVKLFGASTHREPALCRAARRGEVWTVEFPFDCCLTPGAYFVTVAVGRVAAGMPQILSRVHDACMFRVRDMPNLVATGYFDSNIVPIVVSDRAEPRE